MSDKEQLKSMLNNLINDNHEQASLDLHGYLTTKMQEVSGLRAAKSESNESENHSDSEQNTEV